MSDIETRIILLTQEKLHSSVGVDGDKGDTSSDDNAEQV